MREIPNDLVPFDDILELELNPQSGKVAEEFINRRGKPIEVFRQESGSICRYQIFITSQEVRAESEERRKIGNGPQKTVALNCGSFLVSKADLTVLQEIHKTFTDQKALAAARKPVTGWNTPVAKPRPEWRIPDLKFYCSELVNQLASTAVTTTQQKQPRSRELRTNNRSGTLIVRGNTLLPDGLVYYHSFLDELRYAAQSINRMYSVFRLHDHDLEPAVPGGKIIQACRRNFKLILAPSAIKGPIQKAIYKPFTDFHTALYDAVNHKKKWTYEGVTERQKLRLLSGNTYEIHANEQIHDNARSDWRVVVSVLCDQS